MFIIPSIDLSMKLSLSEVFVSNIIVTMVISNKSCCKHVLFTNLSDFISTTTRVTSLKSKKFLFCSFSVAKFGIAPQNQVSTRGPVQAIWSCCMFSSIDLISPTGAIPNFATEKEQKRNFFDFIDAAHVFFIFQIKKELFLFIFQIKSISKGTF